MTDLLVVGGGLAGMAAALEAASAGASVLLTALDGGSSELAQGGIAAAVGTGDTVECHAEDTLAAGAGLTDPAAARLLTAEAPAAAAWLEAQGVAFDRGPDGRRALALEAAHSRPRVLHAGGDASGAAIVAALQARVAALPAHRLERLPGARLEGLLLAGGWVVGARLHSAGGVREARARATLLATGGYAGLFPRTTTTGACDGRGLLAALRAGAELADLELVQFHPTVYAGPGAPFLLTEALRGAGAHVVDGAGRRFLLDVDPRGELAPRAVVARAVAEHLAAGGGAVFLDARHLDPGELHGHFPGFVARCARAGLDPLRDPVPVAPGAHYTMGGIATDRWGRTGVPGLLAAGECARTGVHGANRLASNSLLEAIVFGRRAGRAALAEAAGQGAGQVRCGGVGEDPPAARALLGEAAGPLRRGPALEAALGAAPAGSLAALVLEAALLRDESRGAHVRLDRPAPDSAWASREVVARLGPDGAPALEVRSRSAVRTAA